MVLIGGCFVLLVVAMVLLWCCWVDAKALLSVSVAMLMCC